MGLNKEDMLLVVDPFGFPSARYQQGAQEYISRLENTLSKVDRGIVQTVLINSILELTYQDPFWAQEQAFIEKGYFDDVVRYCWIHAPHAPIASSVYKQDKELPLDGKRRIYLCGATAERCVLYQTKELKRRSRRLDLVLVYDLTLSESVLFFKPYELRRFYKSHEIPIMVVMSKDLPFLR